MSKDLEQITRLDFEAYEEVRVSRVINMLNARMGCELSGLDRETYTGIITHYQALMEKFPGVRK